MINLLSRLDPDKDRAGNQGLAIKG